jgi:NAD(P)-dependent dehydrogenase (short-subunit alcohol dehydrogenase family)
VSTRVLITGAAGGIGGAAMEELRRRGARVVGLDLQAAGEDVIACDIRDQAEVDRAVAEAIERLGGLDVLINNAGVGTPQSAGEAPDAAALAVIDINLMGAWRVTSAALEELRRNRGRVVNVASGLAFVSAPLATAYVMSKRGLVGYSDCLRLEHGDALTVTTVYPGFIKTAIHDSSKAMGFGLDGAVPEEPLAAAAKTLARAALDKPVRDLATTPRGTVQYAAARLSSRRLIDRLTLATMKRMARKGSWAGAHGPAGDLIGRLRT